MNKVVASLVVVASSALAHAGVLEDGVRHLNAKEYSKAAAAFRASAARGNAAAERHLGFMYYRGAGFGQSDAEAVVWFERAAEHGDLESQLNLGLMYENGLSVARSDARSAHWYRMAAEQGDRMAQRRLGEVCYLGTGMPQDRAEAVKWWALATRQDDPTTTRIRAMTESAMNKISAADQQEGRRRAEHWLAARALPR